MRDQNGKWDELLVDFMENDLDPSLKDDLRLILERDPQLKRTQDEISSLRKSIKRVDPITVKKPFNTKLFDSIMAEVREIEPGSLWYERYVNSRLGGGVAAAVAALVFSVALFHQTRSGLQVVTEQVVRPLASQDPIMEISAQDPELLTQTVSSHRDNDDMVLDLMASRMESLSATEQDEITSVFGKDQ